MKNLMIAMVLATALLFSGCTATLPPKVAISDSYSLLGVKTYSLALASDKVNLDPSLGPVFLENYCSALESTIKISMQQTLPEYQFTVQGKPDLLVDITLETLQGGSAAARFWIGYGAGRTVSTAYVRIIRDESLIAEGRITETTAFVNVMSGNYENDQALMQDAPLLARKIVKFVSDPHSIIPKETGSAGNGPF